MRRELLAHMTRRHSELFQQIPPVPYNKTKDTRFTSTAEVPCLTSHHTLLNQLIVIVRK